MLVKYKAIPFSMLQDLWDFYLTAFTPLEEEAMQSHVMELNTFINMCTDERVVKYLRLTEERAVTGMAVSTNIDDIEAWPLVARNFFAKHWPDEYKRGAIWYVGFVATNGDEGAFFELLAALAAPVKKVGGMAFMDFCGKREEEGLPQAAGRWAKADDPRAHLGRVDWQSFWGISYPTPRLQGMYEKPAQE